MMETALIIGEAYQKEPAQFGTTGSYPSQYGGLDATAQGVTGNVEERLVLILDRGVTSTGEVEETIRRYAARASGLQVIQSEAMRFLVIGSPGRLAGAASSASTFHWLGYSQLVRAEAFDRLPDSSDPDLEGQAQLRRELLLLLGTQPIEYDSDTTGKELILAISNLLWREGRSVLLHIEKIITDMGANPEAAAIALEGIGEHPDPTTIDDRFRLLVTALGSKSRWIRDGASLGLAAMRDLRAIAYLKAAIDAEPIVELRQDLTLVLDYIESQKEWEAS